MKQKSNLLVSIVSVIGIVYGDIGTSPLYAVKSCFAIGNIPINADNILGIISLICYSLFLMVTIKYINLILNLSEKGEGGIVVLSRYCANIMPNKNKKLIITFGIIGAALFFSDGIITPAISVLSALEGLSIAANMSNQNIVFLSIIILFLLFYLQKNGSAMIGKFFGPVMIIWFLTIGILGIYNIIKSPFIFAALNPYYTFSFFYNNNIFAILVLGGTILVITGAEAIYADISHFGKKPIAIAWNFLVFPCLITNYLGQGALLLNNPKAIENPFYLSAPSSLLYPLIFLSTIATIIASQSIISGVFSLSYQAIEAKLLPKIEVIHTSKKAFSQVYLPLINYFLCIMTISTVLLFRESDKLVTSYGINVAAVMLITSIILAFVAYHKWKWKIYKIIFLLVPLILIDSLFLITNLFKVFDGGYFTIVIAMIIFCFLLRNFSMKKQSF